MQTLTFTSWTCWNWLLRSFLLWLLNGPMTVMLILCVRRNHSLSKSDPLFIHLNYGKSLIPSLLFLLENFVFSIRLCSVLISPSPHPFSFLSCPLPRLCLYHLKWHLPPLKLMTDLWVTIVKCGKRWKNILFSCTNGYREKRTKEVKQRKSLNNQHCSRNTWSQQCLMTHILAAVAVLLKR